MTYGARVKRSLGLVSALALSASLALGSVGAADAAPAKVLTKAQLRTALLTSRDLPKDFRLDPSVVTDDSGDDDTVDTGDPGCAEFLKDDGQPTDPSAPEAARGFSRNHGMEMVESALQSFPDVATVKHDFAELLASVRSCHHVASYDPSDGTTMHFTIKHQKMTVHGHRAFVVSMRMKYEGITGALAFAGAAVRNNEVTVMTGGALQTPAAAARLTKSLLGTEVDRLEARLR